MINETALFFPNRRGVQLFGVHCAPESTSPNRLAVVLCYPFLQDLAMSYRVYAVLARKLAAAGVISLRFHCTSIGNSGGTSSETTLDTLISDTIDAVDWLAARHDTDSVGLIGIRLGGTIATLVAEEHPLVKILGVHTPVVSGDSYWDSVLRGRQIMEVARGARPKSKRQLMGELATQGHIEILADLWNREFVRGLQSIDLEQRAPAPVSRLMLATVATDRSAASAATTLAARYRDSGSNALLWLEDQREFWTLKSMQDGYVPLGYLQQTVAWLNGQAA